MSLEALRSSTEQCTLYSVPRSRFVLNRTVIKREGRVESSVIQGSLYLVNTLKVENDVRFEVFTAVTMKNAVFWI
jgi:hypothetical protein